MPIFGKPSKWRKNNTAHREKRLENEVLREKKRTYMPRGQWEIEDSGFDAVTEMFPGLFLGKDSFIEKRFRKKRRKIFQDR